jgi:hypothetical protein
MSNGNRKNLGQTLYFSQFGGERPIPDAFVAAMERAEERTSGYAADAEIPQEVKNDPNVVEAYFDTREKRTNEKVLVVIRKKEGNITLRDFRTTDQGQTVQVDSILFYTTDSTFVRSYPSATQDVAIKDLGNGWSIQEVAVSGTWTTSDPPVFVPGIYQGIELSTRREDPIPSSIRSGLPVEETQSIVTGTVEQPTLGDNDLEARERQVGEERKLLSRSSRDAISLPVLERTGKELTDLLPARFRGLIPTARTTTVTEGTVATPTLGTGELVRTEEQVSALVKLVEVISRAGVTFPVVVVDNATITEYGGGPVTITSSIAVNGTYFVDEGEGVVSSKTTKLGEGHELKETVARVAGSWPILPFGNFDARLQTVIAGTKQVVAKGTTTPSFSSPTVTEVREIDVYREQKIVTTQPLTAVDAYVRVLFGNSTTVSVPPQLISLTGYIDLNGGAGSYSENGFYSLDGNSRGQGGIQLHGSAQASASALPEVGWVVKIPRTSNIPAVHILLYVTNGTSRASIVTAVSAALNAAGGGTCTDWPNFRPQPIAILTVGGKVNIQTQVSVSAHDGVALDYQGAIKFSGSSRTSGNGVSYDVARTTRIVQIPETIHSSLSIGGDTNLTTPQYAAQGTINGGVSGATTSTLVYCTATGGIGNISSLSATTGDATIPSSGKRIHRLVTEPDAEFNRTRVFAEIVDFADITP